MEAESLIGSSPLLSPAKARQHAILAKEWAYVNTWLGRQYAPKSVPYFERNENTLRALLALAAANDAADEDARILQHALQETVQEYRIRESSEGTAKNELLDTVDAYLDEDGARDLDDLARMAATLGTLNVETSDLGKAIIELTKEEFDTQHQISRATELRKYLDRELVALREELTKLKSDKAYEIAVDLPAMTAEWSGQAKRLALKIGEYQDRAASLEKNKYRGPVIEDLIVEEECILGMKETVAALEARAKAFHSLRKECDV